MPRIHSTGHHCFARPSRLITATLVALLAVFVSACGVSSGRTQPANTASPGVAAKPMIYLTTFPSAGVGTPAPTKMSETLQAIDAASGTQVWTASLQGQTAQVPVVVGGVVFATSLDSTVDSTGTPVLTSVTGHLYAFDAQTGHLLRQKDTTSIGYAGLYRAGDLLIALQYTFTLGATPTIQATLVALKPSDGTQVWQAALPDQNANYNMTVAQNRVYVSAQTTNAQGDGPLTTFSAYTAATGSPLWSHQEPQAGNYLIATSTTLYASTTEDRTGAGGIVALDATSGALLWQKTLGMGDSLVAADQGLVFISKTTLPSKNTVIQTSIVALDAHDGTHAWQAPYAISPSLTALISTENVVYGAATSPHVDNTPAKNSVFALDAATGAPRWNLERGESAVAQSLAMGTTGLFVVEGTSSGSQLVALKISDGSTLWSYSLNSYAVLGPVVG